eukprot:3508243-Pleurochrysis_carterae.AAC.1
MHTQFLRLPPALLAHAAAAAQRLSVPPLKPHPIGMRAARRRTTEPSSCSTARWPSLTWPISLRRARCSASSTRTTGSPR